MTDVDTAFPAALNGRFRWSTRHRLLSGPPDSRPALRHPGIDPRRIRFRRRISPTGSVEYGSAERFRQFRTAGPSCAERSRGAARLGKIPMRLRQHVGLRYGGATIGQLRLMDHGSREGMGYAASMADGRRGIDRDAPFHGMTPRWSNAVDGVDPNGVFSATTPFGAGMRERDSAYVSQCHRDRWSGDRICVGAVARPPGQGRGSTAADRGRLSTRVWVHRLPIRSRRPFNRWRWTRTPSVPRAPSIPAGRGAKR